MSKGLSELIREGAKQGPQVFGALFAVSGLERKSCALGAAVCAFYGRAVVDPCATAELPMGKDRMERNCPTCPTVVCGALSLIVHLNDMHRWTREDIADLVETLEVPQSIDPVQLMREMAEEPKPAPATLKLPEHEHVYA